MVRNLFVHWAESLAATTFSVLLDRRRAARLEAQTLEDPSLPMLAAVIDALLARTILAPPVSDETDWPYKRVVDHSLLDWLIALASDDQTTTTVRSTLQARLVALGKRLDHAAATNSAEREFLLEKIGDLDNFLQTTSSVLPPEQQ